LGCVVLGAIALVSILTRMSDPATPWVGFVPGPDGTPSAVVQRSGADAVTSVSVEAADADRSVLWAIDRVPGSAWDGTLSLGSAPKAFVVKTALEGASIPAGSVLVVTNGCYASYATVPVGPLTPGVVTTEDQQVSLDEFYSDGGAFTACGAAEFETPLRIAGGGLVLLVAGLVALVASVRRRTA
ncbi:hypothetical protein, partial [Cellulomonas sp. P5_C6]